MGFFELQTPGLPVRGIVIFSTDRYLAFFATSFLSTLFFKIVEIDYFIALWTEDLHSGCGCVLGPPGICARCVIHYWLREPFPEYYPLLPYLLLQYLFYFVAFYNFAIMMLLK